MRDDDKFVRGLEARVGPAGVRFVEYIRGEFWQRARRTALESGLTPTEADDVARVAAAGAVKGFASAVGAARTLREFPSRH